MKIKLPFIGALSLLIFVSSCTTPASVEQEIVTVPVPEKSTTYVEILRPRVNIRKAPKNGSVVLKAEIGQSFQWLATENGWHQIRLTKDKVAYVSADTVLTCVATSTGIPASAFNPDRDFMVENGDPDAADVYSWICRDGNVIMNRDKIAISSTGMMLAKGSELYLGKVYGNAVVFTHKLSHSGSDEFDKKVIDPERIDKKIKPYVFFFSPSQKVFYTGGMKVNLSVL